MSSKFISLIRHGDYAQRESAPSAYQPFPLTEKGQVQAAQAAIPLQDFLSTRYVSLHSCIYSSELLRAWQTAENIRQVLCDTMDENAQIESSMQLAERSVGNVANLTISEIEQLMSVDPRVELPPKDWKSDSFYCLPFPGAESLMQAGKRVAGFLRQVEQKMSMDEMAIVVGHGASIRHAAFHLGILEQEQIARLSMYHCEPVIIEINDEQWSHVAGDWKVRRKVEQPD